MGHADRCRRKPRDFDLDYATAELTATWKQFGLGAGMEILEGNGAKGFTTPLATLHKFQGWADKFLATPANGIEDTYVNAAASLKAIAGLDTLGLVLGYHDYQAENSFGRLRLGMECIDRGQVQETGLHAQVRRLPGRRAGLGARHGKTLGADGIHLVTGEGGAAGARNGGDGTACVSPIALMGESAA